MSATDTPEAFLAEPQICVLCTVGPDGTPHAVPMWYLYEDGVIFMITGPNSQKYKNIERTGQAVIVVDRRTPPYYAVMVKGDAEVGPDLSPAQKLRLAVHYLGKEGGIKYVESFGNAPGNSASIRIRPRKLIEYHGQLGTE